MSYTPQQPDPGSYGAFRASEGDGPGPVPEADASTLENPRVEDSAEPVFVDASGRRRRTLQRLGIGVAVLMAAYLVMVFVSLAGGPRPPVIPLPESIAGDPDQSQTEPDGAESSTPSSPTPGERTATTDDAGTAGRPPRSSASPSPSPVPPLGAVPPGTTPSPVAPTPSPSSTPTPSPTSPSPASPSPSPTAVVPLAPGVGELPGSGP